MDPTVRDRLVSIVRTVVPIIVGFIIAGALKAGLDLPVEDVTYVVETVVIGLYYTAVRWAEDRWPNVGVLLGWNKAPTYQGDGGS